MSYILDALRKSDRERSAGREPAPPAAPAPGFRSGNSPTRSRRTALVAAGAALVAGIGTGVWIGQRDPSGAAAELTIASPAPGPGAASRTEAPAAVPAPAPTAPPPASSPPAEAASAERPAGILELWQLTEAEQRYLQALDVTLHVHSSDPAQRAAIINGLRAREGQDLGEALRLAEIVPDGLILEFQGQMVHLPNPQPY